MGLELNKVNKKIVIFFSLLGFILSFISGLVAGSSFINLFFRSIISGTVIGLLIVAVNIVVIIYLPELLETDEQDDVDLSDAEGHVNIVMPEEKYKVQTDNESIDGAVGSVDEAISGSVNSGIKEVGLDNLKSLSDVGDDNSDFSQSSEDVTDDMPTVSSEVRDSADVGKHSVEDMAKAVKTVLKKD